MKFKLCYIILLFSFTRVTAGNDPKGNISLSGKDIFGTRVFVENKGQFDNHPVIKDKILFALTNNEERIFFTKKGLVYELVKPFVLTEKEKSGLKLRKKNAITRKPEADYVYMNWKGTNKNIMVEESERQNYYFTYGEAKLNSYGYKKITYRNVYDNIDVEYTFPKDKDAGIEYNFILRPGARVNDIEIAYTGAARSISLDEKGNVVVKTTQNDIIEHAPNSFYLNNIPVESNFVVHDNLIGFELPQNNLVANTIVIDPWVANTDPQGPNIHGYDVDYDDQGFLYVYGGGTAGDCKVAKYGPAGSIVWVFNGVVMPPPIPSPWFSSQPNMYAGNFAVQRKSHYVYVGQPETGSGTSVVKLDPNGNYSNFVSNVMSTYDEIWDMGYNCKTYEIYTFGGSTTSSPNSSNPVFSSVNENTGNLDTTTFFRGYGNHSIASHAIDLNGEMYVIFGEGGGSIKNYIGKINAAKTSSVWLVNSNYTNMNGLSNKANFVKPMGSIGYNCLAASNHYLYYYDGVNLAAYNKTTGAQIASKSFTHLNLMQQGGIAVDDCNNVYIGANDSILCFSFSYNYTASIGAFTPDPTKNIDLKLAQQNVCPDHYVHDIKLDQENMIMYVTGSGFAGTYHCNSPPCLNFNFIPTCNGYSMSIVDTYDLWTNGLSGSGSLNHGAVGQVFPYPVPLPTPTLVVNYAWVSLPSTTLQSGTFNSTNQNFTNINLTTPGNYMGVLDLLGTCKAFQYPITIYAPLNCTNGFVTATGLVNLTSAGPPNVFTASTCKGTPLSFTSSCLNAVSYGWNSGGAGGTPSGNIFTCQYNTAGTYTLRATINSGSLCPSTTQSIVITVSSCTATGGAACCTNIGLAGLPNYNGVSTAAVCPGTPFTMTASCTSALVYTVNFGDGSSQVVAYGAVPSHIYTNPGTYPLTVLANGPGCSTFKTINVTVSYASCPACCAGNIITGLPGLAGGTPFTAPACPGVALVLGKNCPAATSFTWNFGDGTGNYIGTNPPAHNYTTPGTYVLTLIAQGPGCYQMQSVTITSSFTNCPGCCGGLTGVSGFASYNSGTQTGQACPLTAVNLSAACTSAQQYTVTWGDGSGSSIVSSISGLAHTYAAGTYVMVITARNNANSCYNTFSITVISSLTNCAPCCSGNFISGSALSGLTLVSPGVYSANTCTLTPLNLSAACGSAASYTWNFGDGTGNFIASSPPAHTYATPGSYSITIKAQGATCYNSQTLTINNSLANCAPCCSPSIAVSGTGLQSISATSQTVAIANACLYVPLNLSATCGGNISWNFGDGSAIYNGSSPPAHYFPNAGTFNILITATSTTCYKAQLITVTVSGNFCNPCCSPNMSIGGTGLIGYAVTGTPTISTANVCLISPVIPSAFCSGAATYTWNWGDGGTAGSGTNPGPHTYATAGNYTITVNASSSGVSGCFSSQLIKVAVSLTNCASCCSPSITMGGTGLMNLGTTINPTVFTSNVCLSTPLNLTANCGATSTYSWNWGDGFTATGPAPPAHTYALQGNYTITVTAYNTSTGCYNSQIIGVTASYSVCNPCCSPSITISGGGLQNLSSTNNSTVFTAGICLSGPLTLTATSCSSATSYTWNFGDGTGNFLVANPPSHLYATPGLYTISIKVSGPVANCYQSQIIAVAVSYTNCQACCPNGFITAVNGSNTLVATATQTIFQGYVCNTLPFYLNANCPGALSYAWNFGDSYQTTGASVSHQYATQSNFAITVTAVGPNCAQSQLINANVSYTNCPPCCSNLFMTGTGFQYLNTTASPTVFVAATCPNTNFNLSASNCTSMATYTWNFGDASGLVYTANTMHQYTTPNNYTISLQGVGVSCYQNQIIQVNNAYTNCPPCCTSGYITGTGLQNLTQTGNPNLFTAYTCPNTAVNLSAASCTAATSFNWDFGNGYTTTGSTAGSQYTSAGNYTILVGASGSNCNTPTQTICVTVTSSMIIAPQTACVGQVTLAANLCMLSATSYSWDFGDGTVGTGTNVIHNYSSPGVYQVQLYTTPTGSSPYPMTFTVQNCQPPVTCTNCIGSFAPDPGDYLINLWVREDISPIPSTYSNAKIEISFTGDPMIYTFGTNASKNKIIEGWQRIEETFTIPPGATHVNLRLINIVSLGGPDAYYDDIRMFPKDGQMKTYVYDPVTLKLSATLDENNYATFYEYDEEGKLIRVKKETEKGIMTIQENKESLKKR